MSTSFSVDARTRAALFTEARSNTRFADREVPLEVIHDVWDMIKWGPTGNNTVPMRLAVARTPEARAATIAAALEGNRHKLEQAPLLMVAARDDRFHDTFEVTGGGSASTYERLETEPERRERMAHTGTLLQAGYLIIGLRAAGLAVRPYGGFDKAAMDEALLSGTSWRSEVLFGVGWPAEGDHGAGERRGRIAAEAAVMAL
ncbi:malonic semialdehyde reductase [Demequina sp. NBRC 110056]|uniref:malonic semialdehyde reductase n=1 Tax=Demequina sp. NBRC 110056 TaxID=1570345 RepID=UPI0013566C4B|nr:malonic semialdehyde reductase [Demequina sp. NBRC 110056]